MDPLDDKVKAALTALEGRGVPHGYFDELPARIDARLEARMQSDTDRETHDPSLPPAVAATTEDSGLHDIKALAKTTRQRISRRQTSQHDIDESLLSASHSGLHAVALPDPAKMVSLPSVDEARQLAASASGQIPAVTTPVAAVAAAEPAATRTAAPKKTIPVWLLAGGGLAAAAAVAAFVTLGGSEPSQRARGGAPSQEETAEPVARAHAATPTKAEEPAHPASGVTAAGIAAPAAAPEAAAAPPPGDTAAEGEAASAAEAVEVADASRDRDDTAARSGTGAEPKERVKERADRGDSKAGGKTASGGGATKADPKDKADKGGGGADAKGGKDKKLDGAVLGAGDKDELGIADVLSGGGSKKEDKPSKTELTSREMRDGLAAINGKAKACYGTHGVAGTVKVKLTIDPSGKVSKASATGSFAGTPTGDCVEAAVKSASFPAWDGRPMSTTHVVLLSD